MNNMPEKQKILIVDDEREVSAFLAEVVEGVGYSVCTAGDMKAFKQAYSEHHPSRIILDLQLKGCDGIELIRHLAAEKSTSEIILVSGVDMRTLTTAKRLGQQYGLNMGIVLQKPVSVETLEDSLRKEGNKDRIDKGEILSAIARGEMTAFFQPQMSRQKNGKWIVSSVEALARWPHPKRGLIMPDAFIPCAEESGIITDLTNHILLKSLHCIRKWEAEGLKLKVSVNLSGVMLADLSLPDRMEELVKQQNVAPRQVMLEITESAIMSDIKRATDILTRLRIKGFELSMDDFGTGYSSLVQLYRLPFGELKIDRSFVRDMKDNAEAGVIVRTLIDLAHNMNLETCAEGVEDRKIFETLAELGCDRMQGYYFGKAVSGEDLPALIKQAEALVV
jgi:EAL domain-containing protein (putative c-di-GMP-specific phosphodiesterase class I)